MSVILDNLHPFFSLSSFHFLRPTRRQTFDLVKFRSQIIFQPQTTYFCWIYFGSLNITKFKLFYGITFSSLFVLIVIRVSRKETCIEINTIELWKYFPSAVWVAHCFNQPFFGLTVTPFVYFLTWFWFETDAFLCTTTVSWCFNIGEGFLCRTAFNKNKLSFHVW